MKKMSKSEKKILKMALSCMSSKNIAKLAMKLAKEGY